MKVFGLSGMIGSGKSIVADIIVQEENASFYRFSDTLGDILRLLGRDVSRENLQALGVSLRQAFGDDVLAQAMRGRLQKDNPETAVIDGVRYPEEYEFIKNLGGSLWFIDASQETRYKRTVSRGTRGEAEISFKEFIESQGNKTEEGIMDLKSKADEVLENNGSMEDLRARVLDSLGKS